MVRIDFHQIRHARQVSTARCHFVVCYPIDLSLQLANNPDWLNDEVSLASYWLDVGVKTGCYIGAFTELVLSITNLPYCTWGAGIK